MTPKPEDVETLAQAIDRVVFPEDHAQGAWADRQGPAVPLVAHLNDSFPRVFPDPERHRQLRRRFLRGAGIPPPTPTLGWLRIEREVDRRLRALPPRWRPLVGGAALVLLGVAGIAYWRQRSGVKIATVHD